MPVFLKMSYWWFRWLHFKFGEAEHYYKEYH